MNQIELAKAVGDRLCEGDQKLMELLGIELSEIAPGRSVNRLTVRDDLVNIANVCQGGILFSLADHALAYACMSMNVAGATLNANMTYTRPAPMGDTLTATAEVTFDGGGRTMTGRVEIVNQDGTIIAQMTGVWNKIQEQIVHV